MRKDSDSRQSGHRSALVKNYASPVKNQGLTAADSFSLCFKNHFCTGFLRRNKTPTCVAPRRRTSTPPIDSKRAVGTRCQGRPVGDTTAFQPAARQRLALRPLASSDKLVQAAFSRSRYGLGYLGGFKKKSSFAIFQVGVLTHLFG